MSSLLDKARHWAQEKEVTLQTRRRAKEIVVRLREPSADHRMRPSFFLAGAMKAGTTSLFNNLVQHPAIAEPLSKEIRYFDFHYARGDGWYLAHFPRRDDGGAGNRVTGEASPSYLFDPHAPRRIATFAPEARVIVLLRNPVDRAYSHYQHAVRYWGESQSFAEAVHGESDWMPREQRRRELSPDLMGVQRIQHSYLTRGLYLDQLTRWWDAFGRENVLVLRSEDYFQAPDTVFPAVLDFLGLESWAPPQFRRLNIAHYPELDDATRAWCYDWFREPNQRLYRALDRDMGWEEMLEEDRP